MKVVVVSSTYHPFVKGGAEVSTQKLAEALVKRGIDVVLLTGADAAGSEELNGVKVKRIPVRNLYWSFKAAQQPKYKKLGWHLLDSCNIFMRPSLHAILQDERPDIVHTSKVEDFSPIIWRVAKRLNYSVVHTVRDYGLMCPYGTMFRQGQNCASQCLQCRALTILKRRLSADVDHVVGNSDAVLRPHFAAGYFRNSERDVIANIYEPPAEAVEPARTAGPIRFGYLGRLHPTKGLELLIDELRMTRLGEAAALFIAGEADGDYEQSLKSRAKGLPVHFMGQQTPAVFFAQIDTLIVPSLWGEPLARVIFEAYAHSVPVIASNRGGSPEIVHPNRTGFIFEPSDRGALASLLSRLTQNRYIIDQLRPLCLSESRRFSEEEIAGRYLNVYRRHSRTPCARAPGLASSEDVEA